MREHSREISAEDWKRFFDETSRHYQGRLVKIEFAGRDIGLYLMAQRLPLLGMTFEKQKNGGDKVEVMAGSRDAGNVTHVVSAPKHVWVRQEVNGGDNGIYIENTAGHMVLIEIDGQ